MRESEPGMCSVAAISCCGHADGDGQRRGLASDQPAMHRSSLNLVDRDRRLRRHGCVGVPDTVAATAGAPLNTYVTALAVAGESSTIKDPVQHVLSPCCSVPISVGPVPRDSCAIAYWAAVLSLSPECHHPDQAYGVGRGPVTKIVTESETYGIESK